MTTLPIIDVGPLAQGDAGLRDVGCQIGAACRDAGFFYVRGGPVPMALRWDVFAAAHTFFAAETAIKEEVSIRRSSHNRGYVGLAVEALDPARGPDRKEAFNVGLDLPADDPEVVAEQPFRGVNLWPALPGFRDTLVAYYDAVLALGRDLHRAIAVELGLPADYFAAKLDRPLATLRLLHYPPAPAGLEAGLGAGEHTDYGNLTLLMTDEVGGLEVKRRGGGWMPVPVLADAFVCNIGDCLMRWTNDVFVSTPHRVRNTAGRERYSVAFFLDANPDAVVDCLPTCGGPERPPRYPAITAADYLRSRLAATYEANSAGEGGIVKTTKAQEIYLVLADDITHGRITPGTPLDEVQIAGRFQVSRTPIREALRQLERSGLVEARPHRGALVRDISERQLDDMFSVMAELEALCARWATFAMSAPERQALRAGHVDAADLVKAGDRAGYIAANECFHSAVYAGAHNDYLAELAQSARQRVAPFRRAQFDELNRLAKSHAEHERVIAAIERGDGQAAYDSMRAHIVVVRTAVDEARTPASRRASPQVRTK